MYWTALGVLVGVGILIASWLQAFGGWEQAKSWYSSADTEVGVSYNPRPTQSGDCVTIENSAQSDGPAKILALGSHADTERRSV